ncbi:hypothetical protein ACFFX0_13900 [Citricoccus parietis]|uniref:Uncharacterized protein n=1 Tax=Citricoccus parietis TaxID=592307 RepID=A0ABV5G012_9MICC
MQLRFCRSWFLSITVTVFLQRACSPSGPSADRYPLSPPAGHARM